MNVDWDYYLRIKNFVEAEKFEPRRGATWPESSNWQTPSDGLTEIEKEQVRLGDIKSYRLAAKLMTHIAEDMEKCALEAGQSWPDERFTSALKPMWGLCCNLAKEVEMPRTDRMYFDAVSRICRKATTEKPNGLLKPIPTKGRRSQMLQKEETRKEQKRENPIRTFLGHSLWMAGYITLLEARQKESAEELLLACCQHYASIQSKFKFDNNRGRIYRSYAHLRLARHYFEIGERATSARYAMLTFILDVLTDHFGDENLLNNPNATGITRFLWTRFGIGHQQLLPIKEQIEKYRDDARSAKWLDCLIHPDFVLSLLMSEPWREKGSNSKAPTCEWRSSNLFPPELRQQKGNRAHYPLDCTLLKNIWDHLEKFPRERGESEKHRAKRKKEWAQCRGEWLERLMAYLFSTIQGLRVRRGLKLDKVRSDIDLLVECLPDSGHWLGQRLGNRIIVECKWTEDSQDVGEVFKLLGKMVHHECDTAMFVSQTTSGADVEKYAASLLRRLGPTKRIIWVTKEMLEEAVLGEKPKEPENKNEQSQGPKPFLTLLLTWIDQRLDEQR